MFYVQLRKVLYGTLQAAPIFWKLLSDILIEWLCNEPESLMWWK